MDGMEEDIEKLYKERGEWVDARREASRPATPEQALKDIELAKHWKDVNATFKFISRYQYLRVIDSLNELIEDDGITPDEIPIIKNILGIKNG